MAEGKDQIVIATAGHVDHGKTTLVEALTGIDTDTTKMEKERGLTINLGFAYFDLPSHEMVGIVDVPGHRKFLKNMLAGLSGINLVLLVIDSTEGVMPQTREHLEILTLLGIDNYIVVLTKVDAADDSLKDLVNMDVTELLEEHQVKAPIVEVDSISGTGMNELIHMIDKKVSTSKRSRDIKIPRMNIDRSFSLKGFGTIITGTLLEGMIETGEKLEVYPLEKEVRIRNIQVHNQNVDKAYPGTRTALNISGADADELKRGYVLAKKDSISATWMLDINLVTAKDTEIEDLELWSRVRVYVGAQEIMGRVVPLGSDQISKTDDNFLQLRLEEPLVTKNGDKVILRSYSSMKLLGGGVVLDAHPSKHKRFDEKVITNLETNANGSKVEIIQNYIDHTGDTVVIKQICKDLNLAEIDVKENVSELINSQKIVEIGNNIISVNTLADLKQEILSFLEEFHERSPLIQGAKRREVLSNFEVSDSVSDFAIKQLANEKSIKIVDNLISKYDFKVEFDDSKDNAKKEIINMLKANPIMPPNDDDLLQNDRSKKEVLMALEKSKQVIRLGINNVMLVSEFEKVKEKVVEYLEMNEEMSLSDFRDLSGASRKYGMLILEMMDKQKVTMRKENKRILVRRNK